MLINELLQFVLLFFSLFAAGLLAYTTYLKKSEPYALNIFRILFVTSLWIFFEVLFLLAHNDFIMELAFSLQLVCILALASFWLLLSLEQLDTARIKNLLKPTIIPMVLVGLLLLTNIFHGYFFTFHGTTTFLERDVPIFKYYIPYHIFVNFYYLIALAGIIVFIYYILTLPKYERRHYYYIPFTFAFFCLWSALNYRQFWYVNLAGLGISPLMLVLLWTNKKHGTIGIHPTARRNVIDHMDDLVMIFDNKGLILDVNPSCTKFLDIPSTTLIGKKVDLALPAFYEIIMEFSKNEYIDSEFSIEHQGKHYDLSIKVRPLYNKLNQSQGRFIILRDITQLRQYISDAEEANRAKSIFLANISHELRTPLNAVIGMSEFLLSSSELDEKNKLAAHISKSASILYDMINNLLDLSKIEANQMTFESIPFKISEVLDEIYILFSHQEKNKSIVFQVDDASCLPLVEGDALRLRQILVNLVSNAFKFTKKGTVHVSINNTAANQHTFILSITISDTGIGIHPDEQKKIFSPFIQADNTITRKFGGTGLGLSICKSLVELQGGSLELESQLGQGTTVSLKIPYRLATLNASSPSAHAVNSSHNFGRILIAEDNELNQQLISMQLGDWGYTTTIVNNGQEAVDLYDKDVFDMIIMDCQMPILDGFQATALIRQKESCQSHVPIIALTASALKEDKEKCFASGMDDYITKPVKSTTLKHTINYWLKKA